MAGFSTQHLVQLENKQYSYSLTSYLVGYIVATTAPVKNKNTLPQQNLHKRILLNTFGNKWILKWCML